MWDKARHETPEAKGREQKEKGEVMAYKSILDFRTVQLVREECYFCHVPFAMSEDQYKTAKQTGQAFYCPNGHRQVYVETENIKLRHDLERSEAQTERERGFARAYRTERDTAKKSAQAYKGHLSKRLSGRLRTRHPRASREER